MRGRGALACLVVLLVGAACNDSSGERPRTALPPPAVTATAALPEEAIRAIVREELARALGTRAPATPDCDIATAAGLALPSVVQVEVNIRGTVIRAGIGTGFVALAGGVIVTAAHVTGIAAATAPGALPDVTVTTSDGVRMPAEVVKVDPDLDLAVLRVAAARLTPVRWASSSAVILGQPVRVIGFPLGRPGVTVTGGVLANRVPPGPGQREELFSDADADPGNSGGPLLTGCGEAIGVVVERRTIATTISTVAVGAETVLPFVLTAAGAAAPTATPVPASPTP